MRSAKMALSGGEAPPLAAHDRKLIRRGKLSRSGSIAWAMVQRFIYGRMQMAWAAIREWRQKRALRAMLKDPRSAQGLPVNRAASKGNRCRPIHDGAPAFGSRREKVRPRRRMDAESVVGRGRGAPRPQPWRACSCRRPWAESAAAAGALAILRADTCNIHWHIHLPWRLRRRS
jgi:hypothetical protein